MGLHRKGSWCFQVRGKFQALGKGFYTDISSCVINNGFVTPFFKLKRGVRQGCPLSGLLFKSTWTIPCCTGPSASGMPCSKTWWRRSKAVATSCCTRIQQLGIYKLQSESKVSQISTSPTNLLRIRGSHLILKCFRLPFLVAISFSILAFSRNSVSNTGKYRGVSSRLHRYM